MVRMSYKEIDGIYNEIKTSASGRQACAIMIMVANEVDAMSAARMLMQLLRTDNIAYVMRPVANIKQLRQVCQYSLTSDIKSVILINCGAIYNIPRIFGLDQGGDVRVFIMDNHRPLHLANIYSRHNIVVFDDVAEPENDNMDIPSDGTDLSAGKSSSEESDFDSDEEDDEEDEDEFEEEEEDMDEDNKVEKEESDDETEMEDKDDGKYDDKSEEDKLSNEGNGVDDKADENGDVEIEEKQVEGRFLSNSKQSSEINQSKDNDDDDENDENDENEQEEEEDEQEVNVGKKRQQERIDMKNTDPNKRQQEDDEREKEEEEEEERIVGKRRKVLEESYNPEKIRRRKLREYYTKNATFTTPTALMILQLVYGRHGAHLPLDQLWQAILGVTDQHLRNHVTETAYEIYCNYLKSELHDHIVGASDRSKYSVKENDVEAIINGAETGNIKEGLDYRFFMHRHWSLFDAMYHSPYIASKMLVWQASGTNKLQELLAKIGLPLHQSHQTFNFIPPKLRTQFRQEISDLASNQEYNLTKPGVMYRSFYRYNSFKNPIAASDVVLAATALLEKAFNNSSSNSSNSNNNSKNGSLPNSIPNTINTPDVNFRGRNGTTPSTGATTNAGSDDDNNNDGTKTMEDYEGESVSRLAAFNQAYDCLGMKSSDLLKKGITTAIDIQKIIVRKAAILLEGDDLVIRLNRLYYCKIDSNTSNSIISGSSINNTNRLGENNVDEPFTRPQVLARLGQFIMDVKRNIPIRHGGWSGASLLPLIMLSHKRSTGTFLVVGISPLASTIVQQEIQDKHQDRLQILTNFRQLFKFAANECGARFWNDSFDTNVVEVHQDDLTDFLGELNDLMKKASSL